ncbi:hypothetical protein HO173_003329 [Letharia columbiana]|uniref:Uncharacterized protein n=1 Tax=Letharia columbiana TaxID=112416 RepID=A0A8H6G1P9_9LECA|nr:uncharacterized protein HO173_003329 [Letharia columbiana]KAF6238822.1 hypothetical protein HO173_003329 [Letharia columbiana]
MTTGTDELIAPPSSRQSSTVPFVSFPETDATYDSSPQTMSDWQGTYHQDLENDLRKTIDQLNAMILGRQTELQKEWKANLLKESEHQTAIRRVAEEFETHPQSSNPPSFIDVKKRKDCADAQDRRTEELIRDIELKRKEKQKALELYKQRRMI